MKKFAENLAALVKVKTLVTLLAAVVFAVLSIKGSVTAEQFLTVFTVIVGFYFGTQHEKKQGGGING